MSKLKELQIIEVRHLHNKVNNNHLNNNYNRKSAKLLPNHPEIPNNSSKTKMLENHRFANLKKK
jgi:hypothetical protein